LAQMALRPLPLLVQLKSSTQMIQQSNLMSEDVLKVCELNEEGAYKLYREALSIIQIYYKEYEYGKTETRGRNYTR
jgi:hypothetical protein